MTPSEAASPPVAPGVPSRRIDWGRTVMVPLCVLLIAVDVAQLLRRGKAGSAFGVQTLASDAAIVMAVLFYVLVVVLYFRRSAARATSGSMRAHVAAIAASWLPFAIPLLISGSPPTPVVVLSATLLLAGLSWSTWSLRTLGRSFSVLAQARQVVSGGPYRWVRHPVYLGELVAALGIVLHGPTPAAASSWLLLLLLQGYRTIQEEAVLMATLPNYKDYRRRTARILPGVF